LPVELYSAARPDLADIRIFSMANTGAGFTEVPYLLIHPHDSSQIVERTTPLLNLSEIAGNTEFLLDLGDALSR